MWREVRRVCVTHTCAFSVLGSSFVAFVNAGLILTRHHLS